MNKPLRILIVDDSPIARIMLKDMLESDGHQVVAEADSLNTTVKAYQEHKPDVVTLDLSLVDGDGLTVLKALRQINDKVKVVVISGNSQKKVLDQVHAAGATGFLGKPFKVADLIAAVARAAAA